MTLLTKNWKNNIVAGKYLLLQWRALLYARHCSLLIYHFVHPSLIQFSNSSSLSLCHFLQGTPSMPGRIHGRSRPPKPLSLLSAAMSSAGATFHAVRCRVRWSRSPSYPYRPPSLPPEPPPRVTKPLASVPSAVAASYFVDSISLSNLSRLDRVREWNLLLDQCQCCLIT